LMEMNLQENLVLMEAVRLHERNGYDKTADLYDKGTLADIAELLSGHPLGIANAIKYIMRVSSWRGEAIAGSNFIATLKSNEHDARRHFLEYRPDSPSIMDTFQISQDRLRKPDGLARAMINFLGFIETESSESSFDFRDFFFEHNCPIPSNEFQDHELLAAKEFQLNDIFRELEEVCFGERLETSHSFCFHSLWLECTRHSMEAEGRIRYARQVLLICHHAIVVDSIDNQSITITTSADHKFLPHVEKCLQVCKSFKMGLDDLKLPENVRRAFTGF